MRHAMRLALVLGALVLPTMVACAATRAGMDAAGAATDGAADAGPLLDTGLFPECTLTSDATTFGGYPPESALPEGGCLNEATCRIGARPACVNVPGPVHVYECSCTARQWACTIVIPGMSTCEHDAGADAGASD